MIQIFEKGCDAANAAFDWQGNMYIIGNGATDKNGDPVAVIKRVWADGRPVETIKKFDDVDETGKEGRGHFVIPFGPNGRLWYGISTRKDGEQGFYVGWLDNVVPLPPVAAPLMNGFYRTMEDLMRALDPSLPESIAPDGKPFEPLPLRVTKQLVALNQEQDQQIREGKLRKHY